MKFLGIAAAVLAVVAPVFAYSETYFLTYDSFFDDGHTSLVDVTCSHGEHGLLTNGHTTFDSLPSYPYVGAAPQISGTQSTYCGSCWEITYTSPYGPSMSINFTAIDAGGDVPDTFSISLEGMDYLTHGLTGEMGYSIPVTATRKSPKACHLD